ncbi:MAG: histidine kinase [Actinomycetaceae bacterium]|nr:histidine kinase [Actinomycetaceae bacterium]
MPDKDIMVPSRDDFASVMADLGLVPFLGGDDQLAGILPAGRVIRFIFPDSSPIQGVAEWPGRLSPDMAAQVGLVARTVNSSMYLPKMTSSTGEDGVTIALTHSFHWPIGATAEQFHGEVSAFIHAVLAVMGRLDSTFPARWVPALEEKNNG